MNSTPAGGTGVSVKQSRKHRRKDAVKFYGFSTDAVIKLGRKAIHTLTTKEQLALESYWNARLAAMGFSPERGYNREWLVYESDIGILEYFNRDAQHVYFIPIGERMD